MPQTSSVPQAVADHDNDHSQERRSHASSRVHSSSPPHSPTTTSHSFHSPMSPLPMGTFGHHATTPPSPASPGTGSPSLLSPSRLHVLVPDPVEVFPANLHLNDDLVNSPKRNKFLEKHIPRSPNMTRSASPAPRRKDLSDQKRKDTFSTISQFYFPDGVPLTPEIRQRKLEMIENVFESHAQHGGVRVIDFHAVTKTVCDLPSYCSAALYLKIQPLCVDVPPNVVGRDAFLQYWVSELEKVDPVTRFFRILKKPDVNYLTRADFVPLLQEVIDGHPGLEFLEETPEFQQRYLQTVIARIFYYINKSGNEKMTLGELRKSNFMEILALLDEEDEINKITEYFSYEHFYVLYVKFWELDSDHNFLLDRDDLLAYGDFALTSCCIDRVMAQVPRRFRGNAENKMSFEDFIVFMISEEDKSTDVAKEYWFRVLDLDGDGELQRHELEWFFREQQQRMQQLAHESIQFDDIFCQLLDMVKPARENVITLADLKNCKLAPFFFNMLMNLSKFIRHEQRDALAVEREKAYPHLSDWERFAIGAYYLLSGEDDSAPAVDMNQQHALSVEEELLAQGDAAHAQLSFENSHALLDPLAGFVPSQAELMSPTHNMTGLNGLMSPPPAVTLQSEEH